MPIPPVQAAGALLAAAPLAEAALSGVSAKFADLLAAAAPGPGAGQTDAHAPGLGLEGLQGNRPATAVVAAEEKLRAETDSLLRQFHQLLKQLLDDRDIDAGGGFRLRTGDDGSIRVAGSHPESARIEDLFASNVELRALFDKILASANRLKGAGSAGGNGKSAVIGLNVNDQGTSVALAE